MKYFKELSDLESCWISLSGVTAMADALNYSWAELPPGRREALLDLMTRELEKCEADFFEKFEILFAAIREDTHEKSTGTKKRKSVRKNAK